jgi:hypothetical protein
VKNILSILFLTIYLAGSLQPSWTLIDFYWNRDDFTQKYCINLDKGITQCRASCYLEKLLEEERKNDYGVFVSMVKKLKTTEFDDQQQIAIKPNDRNAPEQTATDPAFSHFDFTKAVFHPPKS